MNSLRVRLALPEDAVLINRYWAEVSDEDLRRMGEVQRPNPSENAAFLAAHCAARLPPEQAEEGILIWLYKEEPIGYSTLKSIRFGSEAQIHLHMWEKSLRGKGLGATLFCLSANRFIRDFRLKNLYCQPKADNPMPNRMLSRLGFPLLETIDWKHPADGAVQTQNRYLIDLKTLSRHL